jgi:multicomponent Na+:H+ antiporter subunit D
MIEFLVLIFLPIATSVIVYFLPDNFARAGGVLIHFAEFVLSILLFAQVSGGNSIIITMGEWPAIAGVSFLADQNASAMILLSSFLFLMMSFFDLSHDAPGSTYQTLILILQGLLTAILLVADFFSVYVLIEAATIVVTLLILYNTHKRSLYDGLLYLMSNIIAMTLYLFGVVILYRYTGSVSLIILPEIIQNIPDKSVLILPCSLMLAGVSLKAAVFPVFSWLPKAHGSPGAAPAVSALLSGIYVKTGLILLLKLISIFSVLNLNLFFQVAGLITAFAGILLALIQVDLKKLLGYSTISQIGLILFAYSYGSDVSQAGAMLHIVNHALFKSALFLAGGLVVERWQTRDIRKIRNVWREMPVLSSAMIMAMLGVTGAPLFNGSVSKYLIKADLSDGLLKSSMLLISFGTVLYFLKLSQIFKPVKVRSNMNTLNYVTKTQIPAIRQTVVIILGIMCLLTGLASGIVTKTLFDYRLNLNASIIVDSIVTWFVTLAIGFAVNKMLKKSMNKLEKLRLIEPGFNQLCMAMGAYLLVIMIYLKLML